MSPRLALRVDHQRLAIDYPMVAVGGCTWVASVGTQETRTARPGELDRSVVEAKARSNHDAPGLRLPTLPHTGVPITLDRRRTDIWETDVGVRRDTSLDGA